MEHSVLLSELKEKGYEPLIFGKEHPARNLLFARLWDPAQTVFDPAALYLGSTSQMPDPETDSEFTFFCCGEPVDFSRYGRSPFTLAYFGSAVSQAALFNASLESISRLQEISAGMHLLVNALFSGNGLQYLVDTAAQIFGN
ncbi:MAG: PucR family transcriptional regulator, partial [Ruminococcus sp.]|nr:PucR family transcriptional regulator [Ruminococcus sp.]